mgnify:CR=1 FL=1
MVIETLQKLFRRDLEKLKTEISLYKEEAALWVVEKGITNPAGNLCLHLAGNLNAFIGAQLGGTGYVRNRELEFSQKDIPRAELLQQLDATILAVEQTLNMLKEEDLEKDYPVIVFKDRMTTGYFLLHLLAHLGYHLGQVNYHRRLLDQ